MDNYNFDWLSFFNEIGNDEEKLFCELISKKDDYRYTWTDISSIYNQMTGKHFSSDWARKRAKKYNEPIDDEDIIKFVQSKQLCANGVPDNHESFSDLDWKIVDLNVSKWNKSDERIQLNALYRRIAREISLREMGKEIANKIGESIKLPPVKLLASPKEIDKEAILQISDWHYGVEVDSAYNKYNPEIAKERINTLQDKVFEYLEDNEIYKLYVVNLGDLIAGRIHLQLRINSRIDVITQIIEVTELLAQMLNNLSEFVGIEYFDTMDNHSRLEPNLKNNIELESLTRITRWYLQERLKDNPNIYIHTDNEFGDDIISFEALGHNIAAVHGHKDKPAKIIDNLSMMTKKHYDLILSSHLHHFSCDEKNETVLVSNSSLMGTDEYAQSLRLTSKPSQNLIIMTKANPVYCLYKINL